MEIRIENYKNPKGGVSAQKNTCYSVELAEVVFGLCFELLKDQNWRKYGYRIHSV